MYSVANSRTGYSAGARTLRADRDQQADDDDARRAPEEDLDVVPERSEQLREDVTEDLGVEERLLDVLPPRCLRDQPEQEPDDDRSADDCRGDATPALRDCS